MYQRVVLYLVCHLLFGGLTVDCWTVEEFAGELCNPGNKLYSVLKILIQFRKIEGDFDPDPSFWNGFMNALCNKNHTVVLNLIVKKLVDQNGDGTITYKEKEKFERDFKVKMR